MHPILAEIIRCKEAPRLPVLRLWQVQLRDIIAPLVEAGQQAQAAKADAKPASARKGRD